MTSMPPDYECPYFKTKCSKKRDRCPKWVQLLGKDPNTGAPLPTFDCADRWLPVLIIESAMATRGVTETLDLFRKETSKANKIHLEIEAERMRRLESGYQ